MAPKSKFPDNFVNLSSPRTNDNANDEKYRDNWHTGDGDRILYQSIVREVKQHTSRGGSVYIGTDSYIEKKRCVFATAICLHGADGQRGGNYFFRRVYLERKVFNTLVQRILREVQDSIELALLVSEDAGIPSAKIEIHLDISPANAGNGTSKLAEMLTGYAKASGFEYRIKPHAWASQSVADKHSK